MEITSNNFQSFLHCGKKIVLDFYADWCGTCEIINPVVNELEKEYDNVVVGKIDVTKNEELSKMFMISNLPTIIVIENFKELSRFVGYCSKRDIEKVL